MVIPEKPMVRSMEYPCLSMAILKKPRGNLTYCPWEGHGKPMVVPWIFHSRYNKTMVYYQISMVNPWNWPWKVNGNPMDFLWSWRWIPHWVSWELDHWYSVVNLWNIFVRDLHTWYWNTLLYSLTSSGENSAICCSCDQSLQFRSTRYLSLLGRQRQ